MTDARSDHPPELRPGGGASLYEAAVCGLLEYWYPVATIGRLRRRKRLALRIVGIDILLVSDQGKFYAVENRCPHRDIPLTGALREFPGHLTCVYHGWTFDLESGRLVAALTDGPDSPIVGRPCVRRFPVAERCGMVWVWTGRSEPVPIEDDIPEELLRPDARSYPYFKVVPGNWRHASENGFDEAHVKVLHRSALWTRFRGIAAWNDTEITTSADGLWLNRHQRSVHEEDTYPGLGPWPRRRLWQGRRREGALYGGADHVVSIRLPCILRVRQPGRANWTTYDWYVPVDPDRYLRLALGVSWRTGLWSRFVWWLRHWTYIFVIHRLAFIRQDLDIVALMPPGSAPAALFRPDMSIFAWRKLVEEQARGAGRTKAVPPKRRRVGSDAVQE